MREDGVEVDVGETSVAVLILKKGTGQRRRGGGLAHAAASVERKFRDMGERPENECSSAPLHSCNTQHIHTHTHADTQGSFPSSSL